MLWTPTDIYIYGGLAGHWKWSCLTRGSKKQSSKAPTILWIRWITWVIWLTVMSAFCVFWGVVSAQSLLLKKKAQPCPGIFSMFPMRTKLRRFDTEVPKSGPYLQSRTSQILDVTVCHLEWCGWTWGLVLTDEWHWTKPSPNLCCVQELLWAVRLPEGVCDLSSSLVRLNLAKEGQRRLKYTTTHQYSGDTRIEVD